MGEGETGVAFHDPVDRYPSIELPGGAASVIYQCPVQYDPDRKYMWEELIGLIEALTSRRQMNEEQKATARFH